MTMRSRPFGIQRKIFVAFGLFFSLAVAGGGWAVAQYASRLSRSQIEERQFHEVTLLARSVDDKLRSHLRSLEAVARDVPSRVLRDSRFANIWLKDRRGIQASFDHGIFLLGPDGRVLAEVAPDPMGGRLPGHLQPFIVAVVARRQAGVSEAYAPEGSRGPAVMLAAPFLGRDGRVLGVLAGSADLFQEEVLLENARRRQPGSSYLQMFDSRGRVLIHPDPARLMKPLERSGSQDLFDRAIKGFEGSGERINAAGRQTISSLKRLQTTDGILVASLSISEALAPIERLRAYLKVAVAGVVALSLFLTWLISHRLADNLEDVTRQIRTLGDLPSGSRIIRIKGEDEVSDLARSFNDMIGRLEAHEARLTLAKAETDEELGITKHVLNRLVEPGLRHLPPGFHMETLQTQRINGDACTYHQGLPGIHSGLICDATGHGLTAGVSTLPTVQTFLSMAGRDIPLETIYLEINAKLRQMLPSGRFVCLLLVRLDVRHGSLSVLNAGLPDASLLPAHGPARKLKSHNLPAGVLDAPGIPMVEHIAVSEGDRFFAFTDGLQDLLGDRIDALLAREAAGAPFSASRRSIQEALAQGSWDHEQQDDVSWALWEIPSLAPPEIMAPARAAGRFSGPLHTTFSVELALHPRQHSIPSVLPDLLRLVGSQGLPAEAAQTLAVALSEALGNAVDHGLLRLDTRLKEEGFMAYDAARKAGLEAAPAHPIHLRIALHSDAQNRIREVAVDVEDPGPGFDWRARQNRDAHGQRGRGLRMLQSLSLDLGFNEAGNAIHFTLPCG